MNQHFQNIPATKKCHTKNFENIVHVVLVSSLDIVRATPLTAVEADVIAMIQLARLVQHK